MKRRVTRVGWRILATSGKGDRKSTRLNSSHSQISYAVFCLKKKKTKHTYSPVTSSCDNDKLRPHSTCSSHPLLHLQLLDNVIQPATYGRSSTHTPPDHRRGP